MKSFIYRYILYLTVVPFISCNSDLRIEGTYDFADSNDPMKSIIISEADQTGFVSIYYVMESPYSSNAEQIIFAQDRSKPDRTSDGGLLLESEWGQLIFEKPQSFIIRKSKCSTDFKRNDFLKKNEAYPLGALRSLKFAYRKLRISLFVELAV